MAKRVWISFPLITASEVNDDAVVSFLKGGAKKELEVETAAFVTKWMFDRDVPFGIDFNSATLDRDLVMAALPKRVQKALGVTIPVVAETGQVPPVEETVEIVEAVKIDEAEAVEPIAVEQAGEVADAGTEPVDGQDGSEQDRTI